MIRVSFRATFTVVAFIFILRLILVILTIFLHYNEVFLDFLLRDYILFRFNFFFFWRDYGRFCLNFFFFRNHILFSLNNFFLRNCIRLSSRLFYLSIRRFSHSLFINFTLSFLHGACSFSLLFCFYISINDLVLSNLYVVFIIIIVISRLYGQAMAFLVFFIVQHETMLFLNNNLLFLLLNYRSFSFMLKS